jgi:hypothetical protein
MSPVNYCPNNLILTLIKAVLELSSLFVRMIFIKPISRRRSGLE